MEHSRVVTPTWSGTHRTTGLMRASAACSSWMSSSSAASAIGSMPAKVAPHVLKFGCELVMDGRKLPRPVNYVLVRIVPPDGIEIDATQASIRHCRSARRSWAGHRRLQGAERDRRCPQGGSSLLLHRLPARSGARADDRGHRARGGRIPRARDRAPSASRGQARGRRQLPGRMGGHAACSHAARALRSDHRRRLAAVLLGRRARTKPHALHRRAARRQLAHRA